jgi:hypothetical protein
MEAAGEGELMSTAMKCGRCGRPVAKAEGEVCDICRERLTDMRGVVLRYLDLATCGFAVLLAWAVL